MKVNRKIYREAAEKRRKICRAVFAVSMIVLIALGLFPSSDYSESFNIALYIIAVACDGIIVIASGKMAGILE